MSNAPLFAVLYKPGPAWDAELPFHMQKDVSDHRDFLAERYEDETLYFGGPFLDNTGGLSVFRATSLENLDEILKRDRSVGRGLLCYEIRPYALGFTPRDNVDHE